MYGCEGAEGAVGIDRAVRTSGSAECSLSLPEGSKVQDLQNAVLATLLSVDKWRPLICSLCI